jgi:hypothetical protein
MRFDYNGRSLWYGTPDAPAPGETTPAGTAVTITLGVQAAGASNKVEVLYRTNQGPTQTVMARFFRNDINSKAQYFIARLPAFRAGDTVEYGARCQCAGRQVPSPDEQKQLPSSFRVVQPEAREARPTAVLPPKPLAAPASTRHAAGNQLSSVPVQPERARFQPLAGSGAGQAVLSSLLSTSLAVPTGRLQQKFIDLHASHEGPIRDFWDKLRQEPDFKAPGVVEELQLTLQLGLLTRNNVPLVKALQGLRQQGAMKSPRDLLKLDSSTWTQLVKTSADGQAVKVPPNVPGTTQEEKVANYVHGIIGTLKTAFPTAAFAQRISTQPAIDQRLVKTVLAQNPNLHPADHPPANLDWRGMSADDQAKAKASLASLRQEIKTFPGFDYKAMLATSGGSGSPTGRGTSLSSTLQNPVRDGVAKFLANSPDFDFRTTHIDSYLAGNAPTAFQDIPEANRTAVTDQLKRQQRLFRVTTNHQAVEALMAEGLHSAYSIASIPQSLFLGQFSDKLGGQAEALAVHSQAQHVSASALNVYTQVHQALHDVTPRVIGVVADGVKQALKNYPNLETLFGSLSFCDCDHCRSVYSPAAYFVDLLQFLNPKLGEKPIAVLLERRPDLEFIKLNCENTNTLIPYVDLVNEILESYVALKDHLDQTAHNTGDATADELSANPQYVNEAAYETLKRAVYPLALPFDRSLEVARTYLDHLGGSRYRVMKAFQKNNVPSDDAIAWEYLGVSIPERDILTSAAANLLPEFYGFDKTTTIGDLTTSLARVSEFMRATGTSYADLVELVKTSFLNPKQEITLDVPADQDPCDLSKTNINNLDKDSVTLKKMHRFIRLRHKLGWQVRDLDKTMTAFGAADIDDALLRKLAQLKQLQAELNLPLNQLLSFWADIDTDGRDSLYIKLFQNQAVLKPVDPDFSLKYAAPLATNPKLTFPGISYDTQNAELQFVGSMTADDKAQLLGLSADADYQLAVDSLYRMRATKGTDLPGGESISAHTNTILAALRISAADLDAIRAAAQLTDGPNQQPAALNLANLSTLYRHALLAKALKLPIKDLLALMALTGSSPFKTAGDPGPTILFVEHVQRVRKSAFSVVQLNYLYRHVDDPNRRMAPLRANVDLLAKDMQAGLQKIVDDTTFVSDPTGGLLRQKLALVLDASLVDPAMTLIGGTATYSTPLKAAPGGAFPGSLKNRVSYDAGAKQLRLAGIMTGTEQTTLLNLSADADYQTAIKKIDMLQPAKDFIKANLAVFLDPAEAVSQLLEIPSINNKDGSRDDVAIAGKINYVLTRLLDYLRETQSTGLIKQTLSDNLKLDPGFMDLLLGTVLKSHAGSSRSAMADFLALIGDGLTAAYFDNELLTDPPTVTRIDPGINFNWGQGSPDPAIHAAKFSARWRGKVFAQYDETYTFYARVQGGIRLWLDNQPLIDQWANQTLNEYSATIALKQGQLYDLKMEYSVHGGNALAELQWSSASAPKAIVGSFDPAVDSYRLLFKVALLVNTFKMTLPEITYLSGHGADFGNLDFNALPLDRLDPTKTDENAVPLFAQWERLRDLFMLRDSLPRGEAGLLDVFGAASTADAKTQLALVTGWDSKELDSLTGGNGFALTANDFKNEISLVKLQACWTLIKRLGVCAAQLFDWAGKPPEPAQAQDIKNTVKAKYDDKTWLTVAKSLNDKLRESQKAALISYLLTLPKLAAKGIRDSTGLYEYFLIDVDMSACMMTSRIVQANSSVQLFVQRCLMNLEPDVSPASIDADEWKWMKHYRVWEANRKVFLYPENWIEPELRDNKTPFFKELESELLQSDVTADTAGTALLHYLEKLDDVARLEICGMYWQDEDSGTTDEVNILHVFGRTFAIPHIYYYRRRVNNASWTPWEKVQVDIEGDHLIPAVWNKRLYLFWPIFTEKADPKDNQPSNSPDQPKTPKSHREIQLAWSEYKDGKWLSKRLSTGLLMSPRFSQPIDITLPPTWSPADYNGRPLAGLAFYTTVTTRGRVDYLPEPQFHFFGVGASHNELHIHAWRRYRSATASVTTKTVIQTVSSDDNQTKPADGADWTKDSGIIATAFLLGPGAALGVEFASKVKDFADNTIAKTPASSRIPDYEATIEEDRDEPVQKYEYLGYFDFTGCNGKVGVHAESSEFPFESLQNPRHTSNIFMSYRAEDVSVHLTLLDVGTSPVRVIGTPKNEQPSLYTMLYPHQQPRPHEDWSYYPFFYQDKQRAYLATPNCVDPCVQLFQPDAVDPGHQASNQNVVATTPVETTQSAQGAAVASSFNTTGPATDAERGMMAAAQPSSGTVVTSESIEMSEARRG